jgi:Invasin, domain 3
MNRFDANPFLVFYLIILMSTLLTGCGGSVGGLGDNTGQIQLSASSSSLPADGISSSAITATVIDSSGVPAIIGTPVTFSTDLGRFGNGEQAYTVTTKDETGVVVVSFIAASTPGTATITATADTVSQKINILVGLAAGGITLTADPPRIPPDGTSSSAITATIISSAGDPIAMGTPVTFTTTLGLFANGTQTYPITTVNATGVITVALISSTIQGTAEVQCWVGGMSQSIRIEFSEEDTNNGTASLSLSASPNSIPADGTSTSALTAAVRGEDGQPAAIGTSVVFTTTLGAFPNTNTTYTATTTDETGTITVSLTSGTTPGTASVEAESMGINQTTQVQFEDPET